ncbi:MAG: SDR family oxidoreductase, partial [Clostridiales bacterium]
SQARVLNMYGPTEAAVYVTVADLARDEQVHIGKPLQNCRIYALDESGQMVMPTALGDLYLAGDCLAEGYMGREDLTAKAFVPDPFFPGHIMYRSGDIGRLRTDGNWDFLGRSDAQIKINGQRVELTEITGAMLNWQNIDQAIAVPIKNADGSTEICGFLTFAADNRGCKEELQAHLAALLPDYMLPSRIFPLNKMPYTPSGKMNLPLLKKIALGEAQDEVEILPFTSAEEPMVATEFMTEEISVEELPVEELTVEEKSREKISVEEIAAEALIKENILPKNLDENKSHDLGWGLVNSEAGQKEEQAEKQVKKPAETRVENRVEKPIDGQADGEDKQISLEKILSIWQNVLGRENLANDISFFSQGGSSLGALNVLSRYFNLHLPMTLQQFYENPTALGHLAFFKSKGIIVSENKNNSSPEGIIDQEVKKQEVENQEVKNQEVKKQDINAENFAEIASQEVRLESKAAKPYQKMDKVPFLPLLSEKRYQKELGTVFLTGATGFLGVHLLQSLLENGAEKIICLLRDGDRERLLQILGWYFGHGWLNNVSAKIAVLKGDITLTALGLASGKYQELVSSIDNIYHSAADVRHYVAEDEDSLATNIQGTENMIELALAADTPLHYMSTASICGDYLLDNPQRPAYFSEDDFDIGQNWQDNIYIKGKFLAEAQIYQAMERGLVARVYRLGLLVGRASDGVFQMRPETNSFFRIVQGIAALGVLPRSLCAGSVDLLAVDICAEAVLALRNAPLTAYHIINPHPYSMEEVAEEMLDDLQIVEDSAFDDLLTESLLNDPNGELASLVDFWNRCRTVPLSIQTIDNLTNKYLQQSGFQRQEASVKQLLAAFSSK